MIAAALLLVGVASIATGAKYPGVHGVFGLFAIAFGAFCCLAAPITLLFVG